MKIRLQLDDDPAPGKECPAPLVTLHVRDRYGLWTPIAFRVDTQADFTTFPIARARQEGIPFRENNPGQARGMTGTVRKYQDRIHLSIAGREHDWPCDFIETARDQATGQALRDLPPVLGRAGFLRDYAISVDDGFLIVTHLGPLRRWWRRLLHRIWARFGMIHRIKDPL